MRYRILIADDHEVVRRGLASIIAEQPDWELVGEALTGREAVEEARKHRPNLVVMDISMPDLNGLEATRQILKELPATEVLILSMHESEQMTRELLACGARGYVLKSDATRELVAAVETLRRHKQYFTTKVSEVVLKGYLSNEKRLQDDAGQAPRSELTARQREVVQLVAEGKSNKEIAGALTISVQTVETHRSNIMTKLNLHSVSDLVRYAVRNGIMQA